MVDYIAMDIKTTPDKYQQFVGYSGARIPDSVKMIIGSGIRHEFRSTCVKPMVDGNIEDIGKLIQGADLYVLQNMRPDVMLDTNFIKDDNQIYTDQDLQGLKMIISPYVKKCIVR
jgi:pyruvate formate lyase activating enzyme